MPSVEPYFLCGECAECKAGTYNLCAKMGFIGLAGGGGGLSQSELGEARKEKARSTGVADHVIDPSREDIVARVRALTDGDGADVCFECTSVNAVLDELFDAVRPAGVIVNVSIWSRPATIDMQKLVLKEIDLRGTIAYAGDHPATIKLVQEGKIDLKPFITSRVSLDQLIDKGFDTLINHKDTAVKVLVHPGRHRHRARLEFPARPVLVARSGRWQRAPAVGGMW